MKDRNLGSGIRDQLKPENSDQWQSGFTLVEVLVSVSIFAIVMLILYSTFSTSSVNAKVVEGMADDLSALSGALDAISHEVRGAYSRSDASLEGFSGRKDVVTFATMTPFVREGEPTVQRISYIFEEDRLIRKSMRPGSEKEVKGEFLLLDGIKEPAFYFLDGTVWVDEWPSGKKLPAGIKVVFSYRERKVENVIPVWSRM